MKEDSIFKKLLFYLLWPMDEFVALAVAITMPKHKVKRFVSMARLRQIFFSKYPQHDGIGAVLVLMFSSFALYLMNELARHWVPLVKADMYTYLTD